MKSIVMIAAMLFALLAPSISTVAQEREATQLDLDDLGWTGATADSVLALHQRPYLWGWNWLSTDRNVSATLRSNLWHLQDPFAWWPQNHNDEFGYSRVPGQLLVTTINDLSFSTNINHNLYQLPCEAISMEWQPWLVPDTDTFALRADDSTGGVWGFRGRDTNGTVVHDATDHCYRYRLETSNFFGETLVLWDVEKKNGLTRWTVENPGYNTDVLWLAINLRRNDSSSDAGHENDTVLRIRVPVWTRDPCPGSITVDSTLARFRFIPVGQNGNDTVSSTLNEFAGVRWDVHSTDLAPNEIVITRRMLPAFNTQDPDITIYAQVLFDSDFVAVANRQPYNNPVFVSHSDDAVLDRIDRVSVNVLFTDELGVDIKSIRLESPEARELFWGQKDSIIRDAVDSFMTDAASYNRDTVVAPGDQPRLWRIYTRDEIRPMHWKGFRYINRLLHNFTTSEWNIEEFAKARHCLGLREFWQGTTLQMGASTPSPVIRHGVQHFGNNVDSLHLYLGFARGRDDTRDFETRLHAYTENFCDTVGCTYGALPLPADSMDFYLDNYHASVLGRIERAIKFGYAAHPQMLFDSSVAWIANTWEYASFTARRDIGQSQLLIEQRDNGRVKSAEEMRLQQWQPIILGSKGSVHYSGVTQRAPESVINNDWHNATSLDVDVGAMHGSTQVFPVTTAGDARVDDDAIGTDYVLAADSSQYWRYMPNSLATTAAAMNNLQPNPPGVPLFRKSMRQVIRETQRSLAPFIDTLNQLRLVAWRAKGFRSWYLGDTNTFELWLNKSIDAQRVWVTTEQDPSTQLARPRPEPYDSTFYDITLLRRNGAPVETECYIGVLNRRTDPRLDTVRWQDDVPTFDEFKAHVRVNPEDLFEQYGSRRIRIPFNYTGNDITAVNLRVREIRDVDTIAINVRPPIDTIIGRTVALDVDMLPGEGKIFRVTTVPASSTSGSGFLDHSNQRKMVAFPAIDTIIPAYDVYEGDTVRSYVRMVVGDTMRYYRVFHKRRTTVVPNPPWPPIVTPEAGVLTVWYQRSNPIIIQNNPTGLAQNVFDASTISWETAINVSSRVLFQPPGADSASIMELSCGYPALVVRLDTFAGLRISKVYIVFGCEFDAQGQNPKVLVCETVLPAGVPTNVAAGVYATDHSEVHDVTPAPNTPILEHWGTPMINASASGNYYCWSNFLSGIGVGFKQPHSRTFQAGQIEFLRLYNELVCSHPSMNSYSRLHIGEDDAGVVWQEGADPTYGNFILYTRLKHDNGFNIYHELCADATPYEDGPGFQSPIDGTIAQLTDIYVNIDDTDRVAHHAYPVLYRHLSDWEMGEDGWFYDLGIVNKKAERAYWQSLPQGAGARWTIGRRIFDINEWTQSPGGGTDTLWSQAENFIFSDDYNLKGPDAAQGEQWGEWGSIPEYPSWDYDDSTMVLEFWSDTASNDPAPSLWHFTMGWDWYGDDYDFNHTDLVDAGVLQLLHDKGKYPHLAARYSMIAQPGWQRNRRIFNRTDGTQAGYAHAPTMVSSSEYFYKEAQPLAKPFGVPYVGYRGKGGSAVVSPVRFLDDNELVPLMPVKTKQNAVPTRYSTDWITIKDVEDISIGTKAIGDNLAAELMIQRESDQEIFSMNAVAKNQDGATWKRNYTLLSSNGERYRFFIEPKTEGTWPALDFEIGFQQPAMYAKQDSRKTIIDLRSMKEFSSTSETDLIVYPNPAFDNITMVVNTGDASEQAENTFVEISSNVGVVQARIPCRVVDVIRLDVSAFAAGTYTATLVTQHGIVSIQRVCVVR